MEFFLAVFNFHDPEFEPNSNFKNGSDHTIVKYSLYTVILGETDLVRLFKKAKIFI